jgi:hypothetical protein
MHATPEYFLDLIQRQQQGRLKIYLGYAAGVVGNLAGCRWLRPCAISAIQGDRGRLWQRSGALARKWAFESR